MGDLNAAWVGEAPARPETNNPHLKRVTIPARADLCDAESNAIALGRCAVSIEEFERFVSASHNEPHDIDIDFGDERREDVISISMSVSAVIALAWRDGDLLSHLRAVRDVGEALGLSPDVTGALAGLVKGWSVEGVAAAGLKELSLDPSDRRLQLTRELSKELKASRHLSQHPGGLIILYCPILIGPDVLVDAEKVRRIVFAFQGDQPVVIVAIGGLQPAVVLIVHHEVHIAAAIGIGMHGFPIAPWSSRLISPGVPRDR